MLFRETQLGFRTVQVPNGLVVPVNVFDGQFFPQRAKVIQWLDCRKFWIVGEGFARTERYVEFQDALRGWSEDVARAIQSAPAWNEHWMTAPWIDVADDDLMPPPTTNFTFVGLE
jgi:hypothetical protein